jgi:hypothetical protein
VDKQLYKNVTIASFTVNDVEAGCHARDTLANRPARNDVGDPIPAPTEDELREDYEVAARAARVANEIAKVAPQQWELLQKDHANDTQAEDSLNRYLSEPKTID